MCATAREGQGIKSPEPLAAPWETCTSNESKFHYTDAPSKRRSGRRFSSACRLPDTSNDVNLRI